MPWAWQVATHQVCHVDSREEINGEDSHPTTGQAWPKVDKGNAMCGHLPRDYICIFFRKVFSQQGTTVLTDLAEMGWGMAITWGLLWHTKLCHLPLPSVTQSLCLVPGVRQYSSCQLCILLLSVNVCF